MDLTNSVANLTDTNQIQKKKNFSPV